MIRLGVEVAVRHLGHGRDTGGLEEFGAELLRVRRKFLGQFVSEDLRKTEQRTAEENVGTQQGEGDAVGALLAAGIGGDGCGQGASVGG